jgi:hypothetical protein
VKPATPRGPDEVKIFICLFISDERKEEARIADERKAQEVSQLKGWSGAARLQLQVEEKRLEYARMHLDNEEKRLQQIQEDIRKAGWVESKEPTKTGWGSGSGPSLVEQESKQRETIRIRRESVVITEKERERILARIASYEEKIKNLE